MKRQAVAIGYALLAALMSSVLAEENAQRKNAQGKKTQGKKASACHFPFAIFASFAAKNKPTDEKA